MPMMFPCGPVCHGGKSVNRRFIIPSKIVSSSPGVNNSNSQLLNWCLDSVCVVVREAFTIQSSHLAVDALECNLK